MSSQKSTATGRGNGIGSRRAAKDSHPGKDNKVKVFIGANSDPHIINDPITGNQRPPDPDDAEGYAIIPPHNYQKWEQHREWQGKVTHFVTLTGVWGFVAAILFHIVKALVGR